MNKYLSFIPIIGIFIVFTTDIIFDMMEDPLVFIGSAVFQGFICATLLILLIS